MEGAGGIGTQRDDVVMLGTCDDGVRRLARELGWEVELEKLYKDIQGTEEKEKVLSDETIEEEVRRLTEEVERELKVAEDYQELVEGKLKSEDEKRREMELKKKIEENLEGKIPEEEDRDNTESGAGGLENDMPRLSLKGNI